MSLRSTINPPTPGGEDLALWSLSDDSLTKYSSIAHSVSFTCAERTLTVMADSSPLHGSCSRSDMSQVSRFKTAHFHKITRTDNASAYLDSRSMTLGLCQSKLAAAGMYSIHRHAHRHPQVQEELMEKTGWAASDSSLHERGCSMQIGQNPSQIPHLGLPVACCSFFCRSK